MPLVKADDDIFRKEMSEHQQWFFFRLRLFSWFDCRPFRLRLAQYKKKRAISTEAGLVSAVYEKCFGYNWLVVVNSRLLSGR